MLKIEFKGLDTLQLKLKAMEKQVPFAAARTITTLGRIARDELKNEIRRVFQKPTAYIVNSPFSTAANKKQLRSIVGIRDQAARGASPAQYIKEHFTGGYRGQKPFEVVLSRMNVLPSGWKAIPGEGLYLDSYGNPYRDDLKEIIGNLKSGQRFRTYTGRGKNQKLVGYFVVRPGSTDPRTSHLHPGVWKRIQTGSSGAVVPMLVFVPSAGYRRRINLRQIVERVVRRDAGRLFKQYFDQAMRTAR